ncbi:MAG TPA: DEAD/DEAH box helicase family protein [Bacteroidales bacterium]|nr:DEAD/DEAH box helicase family protein [Bacteroidales bacterium]
MSKTTDYISNTMSLREPLKQSLELLDTLMVKADLIGNSKTEKKIESIKKECSLFEEFERAFPSVCFSIATGIGKTRLMGAFVTYLVKEKGIKNFFILSPNITIYEKLKDDFGNKGAEKYVFKGLTDISNNAVIITGEDYETKGIKASEDSIQINMFNIGKINADVKTTTKDGRTLPPRIKRFRETIGDSYYNYLMNLKDLVIIMDESHRYRGERGMETLNELNPLLGIELTATPIDASTNQRFKNVVFEYGLADALKDGKYIKNPAVVTRADTDFKGMKEDEIEKLKLKDAIQMHRDTKIAIENYVADNNLNPVKPTILVSCKDTTHAKSIFDYVTSDEFYDGEFKEKTLQIDSTSKTDEQVEQLLTLEKPNNSIEIVIHVDMLKEGWDVSNLYTIVPLRAANALTLIEQTIGRGLRLPFGGKRTGVEKVDMLSIMMHDKFQEVVDAAKDKSSILYSIGKIQLNKSDLNSKKVSVESKTKDVVELEEEEKKINLIKDKDIRTKAERKHKAKVVINTVIRKKISQKVIQTPNELKSSKVQEKVIEEIKESIKTTYPEMPENEHKEIAKDIETTYQTAVEEIIKNNILIPNIKISISENKGRIKDFDLNTKTFSENILQQEFELIRETIYDHKQDKIKIQAQTLELPEYSILELLKKKSEIDYDNNSDVLYKLCSQAVNAIKDSLKKPETLGDTILMYRELIANKIYEQVKENITIEIVAKSKPEAEPYSLILPWNYSKEKDDEILNFRETVSAKILTSKVFNGFSKSCHDKYKFDSIPEKRFAEILENSDDVIKWLRPASKQFNIWYNNNSDRYVPDFVAETADLIYLIEIKAENELDDKIVKMKEEAAINYCKNATEINKARKEKAWKYAIIPHDKTDTNMTFKKLVTEFGK